VSLFVHDSLLGHAPNPGFRTPGFANTFHTIDADGLRFGGERPASSEGAILAVGDSFTYGDEVNDDETWPAQLQRLTGRPVLNGGVTGYGFDQIVLRAERLTAQHKPSILIVSFIQHDVWRVSMRRLWGRDKPWFEIANGQLVLKGVPVPDQPRLPVHVRLRLDRFMNHSPRMLRSLLRFEVRAYAFKRAIVVAERLVERLAKLRAEHRVKVVIMAQYAPVAWAAESAVTKEQRRITQVILDRAAACSIATLDTFQRLAAEPKPLDFYGVSHLNARGNRMIASLLAATLPTLLQG
jgi:lysophospholipase L1-like esterase